MRRLQLFFAAGMLSFAAACDHQIHGITMHVPLKPLRLAQPETTYSLSPGDRAKLRAGFDGDALERLLGMVIPEMRQEILMHFQVSDGTGRRFGQLVQFHDARLQPLLEEV